MVIGNDLAKAGCKYLGRTYDSMDCQAFVEKCLADCGIHRNLSGSNAWYREMTWTGTPEECRNKFGGIPDGAFLFILKQDSGEPAKYKNDGIGNASHIGIRTGMSGRQMVKQAKSEGDAEASKYNYGNGAIHSSASRGHVCTSEFKDRTIKGGWNMIGLWNRIDYGEKINKEIKSGEYILDVPETPESNPTPGIVFASIGTTVKMRQRPSTGCGVYWNVPIGDTVDILQTGDWDRIRWNGYIGYMRSTFVKKTDSFADIEPEEPKVQLARVWAESGNTVKMRQKPSLDCNLYECIPIGTTVTVRQKGDRWSKIDAGIHNGWYMMTRFLQFEEQSSKS